MRLLRRRTRGFTLVEMLVSIALMAVLATALGNMLGITTYQATKSRTDLKMKVFFDREVNFYTYVPYTELVTTAGKVLDPGNTDFNYTLDTTNPFPPGVLAYDSYEGTDALPMYLVNPPPAADGSTVNGMYNYTITRQVVVYPDHKEINLWFNWFSPSPNYSNLMSPVSQNGTNTVPQSYSANVIYRFP